MRRVKKVRIWNFSRSNLEKHGLEKIQIRTFFNTVMKRKMMFRFFIGQFCYHVIFFRCLIHFIQRRHLRIQMA